MSAMYPNDAAMSPLGAPCLTSSWPALVSKDVFSGVGVLIISYNTSKQTLRCLQSLERLDFFPDWVFVLDNASASNDFALLLDACKALPNSELRLYRSSVNLGFAGGTNYLVNQLLEISGCRFICLLNNDAVAMPTMVQDLVEAIDSDAGAGLVGGRMHRLHDPSRVDTLGIALYASLMPADRRDTADPYLGPTGGCLLMTRLLVSRLMEVSGYCFDDRFFCYCEDTDLVLRSVLLGYRPVYVDSLLALHEGQASTGGGYNSFIAYHGLRNTMWMQWKLIPSTLLVKYGPLLALAHLLSIGKLLLNGEFRLLWSIYWDAFKRRSEFFLERQRFQAFCLLTSTQLDRFIAPRFYRQGYLLMSLGQLWTRYTGRKSERTKK